MILQINAVCKWVRRNNGITEVLFTDRPDISDHATQEQHVLMNVASANGRFTEGTSYTVEIRHAFPQQPERNIDMPKYHNKEVTVVRDAKQGDPNFDASKDQVIVTETPNGTEKTVLRSDVKE